MSEAITGACLCGRVRFSIRGNFTAFHLCHCSQCRRSTGSAHASNLFTEPGNIEWLSGQEFVKPYIPPQPDVISKSFCSHCGSLVPYTSLKSGRLIVPAGSLDQSPGISPDDNIFWQNRADWYDAGIEAVHHDRFPDD